MPSDYYIYINGFWNGFVDKTDANHIDFFELIFAQTKLRNYTITNDINNANVLFESVFARSLVKVKQWKYKIHYSGEPFVGNTSDYDLILFSSMTHANIVDLPLFVYYIHVNNFMDKLIRRPIIRRVPDKFCCFIVSNGKCAIRNKMFEVLNQYKKVHSYGKFNNNMNFNLPLDYWTDEFREFISQYKFIICFENSKFGTYSTEKIVNPYLAGIIPIYWASSHIHNVFNSQSMLFLDNEDAVSYQILLNRIIELDKSDYKYLEFVNRPILNDTDYWKANYTISEIAHKIDNVI
jgi:hypothetical protein